MNPLIYGAVLLIAYALGSIPTALLYSRLFHRKDIRALGDGNMGARNTRRQFGFNAGVIVALIDIIKGALAVLLSMALNLPLEWAVRVWLSRPASFWFSSRGPPCSDL
ncbi:MAG: hypothetical protein FD147_1831 [Chloroflexi bacterium]|nr:MAG: hypothetical protein FD147_1831 [Chloroflexota bacterium]